MLLLAEEATGAANDHFGRSGDVEVSDATIHDVLGVKFSHNRVRTKVPDSQPKNVHFRLSRASFLEEVGATLCQLKASGRGFSGSRGGHGTLEVVVRNLIVVGSCASARLFPQEQQGFYE